MLKKLLLLIWTVQTGICSAQIYECKDEKGSRIWTNQACPEGVVLHQGVDADVQRDAERADREQRARRQKESADAAQRFRQNAYDSRVPGRASTKSLQRCDATRRALRIERAKTHSDGERIRQLSRDESKYC
ncbi:hypothetical protein E9531_02910 [Lampropedia puyangensis]|uniref:DUF4124 domain-containing protein n=1 Tax=Lampropedia puyangensis TaxID=1330072 RepID=A0A4S8FD25_9BURK|nr:hypothetical protein [Lampropedia puyangensis]THU05498.1 hypothetical protein E9531_02910 [Lampropedia puyangensis]